MPCLAWSRQAQQRPTMPRTQHIPALSCRASACPAQPNHTWPNTAPSRPASKISLPCSAMPCLAGAHPAWPGLAKPGPVVPSLANQIYPAMPRLARPCHAEPRLALPSTAQPRTQDRAPRPPPRPGSDSLSPPPPSEQRQSSPYRADAPPAAGACRGPRGTSRQPCESCPQPFGAGRSCGQCLRACDPAC